LQRACHSRGAWRRCVGGWASSTEVRLRCRWDCTVSRRTGASQAEGNSGRSQAEGNSVRATAMFCKWCEMAGFKHNDRGKPTVWTGAGGGCQRANLESVKDHEGTQIHKEAANLLINQSDMKEAVKTAIPQHDHVLLNLTSIILSMAKNRDSICSFPARCLAAEMLTVEVKTKGEDGNMTRDTHFFLLSLRDSRLSRRGCRPGLLQESDPRVRLRPRPNPLFCLSFRVWRMFYSMISSTMSPTQKACQSRGPVPLSFFVRAEGLCLFAQFCSNRVGGRACCT